MPYIVSERPVDYKYTLVEGLISSDSASGVSPSWSGRLTTVTTQKQTKRNIHFGRFEPLKNCSSQSESVVFHFLVVKRSFLSKLQTSTVTDIDKSLLLKKLNMAESWIPGCSHELLTVFGR